MLVGGVGIEDLLLDLLGRSPAADIEVAEHLSVPGFTLLGVLVYP
jgi:hypothetical protein